MATRLCWHGCTPTPRSAADTLSYRWSSTPRSPASGSPATCSSPTRSNWAPQRAGIAPDEVDVVISTTITGIAVPSIEARIAQLVDLRPDVKRMPLFGLGCVAGAAGIARLHDYLIGHPNQVGALLSVELCSLTVQRDDHSADIFESTGPGDSIYPPPRLLTHISRSAAWSLGDRRLACDPHVSSGALNDVLPRASFIREDLTGLGRDTLQGWRTVAGMAVR